jgi:ribose 5-phosphate isomerase A
MNAKQAAAEKAVSYIHDGMTIGLGSGTTASFAIDAIGRRVREGLSINGVASSLRSEALASKAGIRLVPFSEVKSIDLYIDGADEVDKDFNLLKGGGGALLREKILAYNSKMFIVIIDSAKLVDTLGKFKLAVEVTPFAMELTIQNLENLGCLPNIRIENGKHYITDNGNLVIDCAFNMIKDVQKLSASIHAIPGVVENGLFANSMVGKIIVGYEDGQVREIEGRGNNFSSFRD